MDSINQKIVDLELPFMMDTKTKGRGNCFFHAIVQQIERNELQLTYYRGHDHRKLRTDVCTFAINQENDSVATMTLNYDSIHGEGSWTTFFKKMAKANVFIEGPVAQVMAIMLERSMYIVSQGNNDSNPYMTLNAEASEFPPLILANIGNVHYQSYLPVVDANVEPTLPVKSTPVVKSAPVKSTPSTPSVVKSTPLEFELTPLPLTPVKSTATPVKKQRGHDLHNNCGAAQFFAQLRK